MKMTRMNIGVKILFASAAFSTLVGCASDGSKSSDLVIDFEGRNIDIAPYVRDFPYTYFNISKDGTKMLFFKASDKETLQSIDIKSGADIRNASDVVDIDFSIRNCWDPYFNNADGYVYWKGDEKNDEIINLYRTIPGSNSVEKLTNVPYIYSAGFSPDQKKYAYVGRMAQYENRLDELHVLDLASKEDVLVRTDDPDFRYTWGDISWQPEGKGLLLMAVKGMNRTYTNVLYVDLETKEYKVLTNPQLEGSLSGTIILSEWFDNDNAFFISDQDGYQNLYRFNLQSSDVSQLTHYTKDIEAADFLTMDGKKYLLAVQSDPISSRLVVIDPQTGGEVVSQNSSYALSLGSTDGSTALLTASGTTTLFKLLKADFKPDGVNIETIMDTPSDIQKKLVHSTVERLEIPTFDIDPATGKTRMLHAYLYKPDNPLPEDKKILLVESFYGGMNSYSSEYQVYTEAGMYVLSAAPRGSAGFGRDFAAMNDRDLGGNETIDMIYAAKYVSEQLGIPSSRVGVFGMSHGGYETMRLMTFPGEVNGIKASFPFGFGMEAAGFCDINWIYYHSNIPDWIDLEAGNPATDSVKLAERSPINYAELITGPMLLIHGTNDNRVDITGSSVMAEKLDSLGLPNRFVKFEGCGHGYKGAANQYKFFKESLGFIEDFVLKPRS